MSEQSNHEPTMEEILASIRRIISEDEAPAEEGPAVPEPQAAERAKPEPEISAAPSEPVISGASESRPSDEYTPQFDHERDTALPELDDDDDDGDLELTQRVETHGDLDVVAPTPPAPEPLDLPAGLVSDHVAAAAAATFSQLGQTILMPAHGRTLEDVVRELLTPLLKDWLDTYLPGIVQEAVNAEVERIARGRVR